MTTKVLLFAQGFPEDDTDSLSLPHLPALRAWQLVSGLRASGIDVTVASGHRLLSQDGLIAEVAPDAVLYSPGWEECAISTENKIPIIIDLFCSRGLVGLEANEFIPAERKLLTLARSDCLLTSDRGKQLYYSGWLVQAGRVAETEHFIRHVPLAAPEWGKRGSRLQDSAQLQCVVHYFGQYERFAFLDSLSRIAELFSAQNRGRLRILLNSSEFATGLAQSLDPLFVRELDALERRWPTVLSITAGRGFAHLVEELSRANLLLDQFPRRLETRTSFPDPFSLYLSSGVPLIVDSASEVAELVRQYRAGWVVSEHDNSLLEKLLRDLLAQGMSATESARENAFRLGTESYSLAKVIQPLSSFLAAPLRAEPVTPACDAVYPRPSFLGTRGKREYLELDATHDSGEHRFVVPAENIETVVILYRLQERAREEIESVEAMVIKVNGRKRKARVKLQANSLSREGSIRLSFSPYSLPRGGEELAIRVRVIPALGKQGHGFSVAVAPTAFPMIKNQSSLALALSFVPAEHAHGYQLRLLWARAVSMIKQGEWKRLSRAVLRRMPTLLRRARA